MATKKAKKVTTTTTTTTTTTVTSAPSKSRIFFILDRSGSMHTLREAAVGGFNKFIADQRAVEGEAEVSLTIFDTTVETVFSGVDLHAVKELTQADFVPRGYTALYDALGQTITAARDTHSDDVQTIIVVMTDGAENASREFTQAAVQALVKDVEATLGWETIFLGANIDVAAVSHSLGIKSKNAVEFAASAVGISAAYMNSTMATTAYRSGNKSFSFDSSSS